MWRRAHRCRWEVSCCWLILCYSSKISSCPHALLFIHVKLCCEDPSFVSISMNKEELKLRFCHEARDGFLQEAREADKVMINSVWSLRSGERSHTCVFPWAPPTARAPAQTDWPLVCALNYELLFILFKSELSAGDFKEISTKLTSLNTCGGVTPEVKFEEFAAFVLFGDVETNRTNQFRQIPDIYEQNNNHVKNLNSSQERYRPYTVCFYFSVLSFIYHYCYFLISIFYLFYH